MPDDQYPYEGMSPFASLATGLAHGSFDYLSQRDKEAKDREDQVRKNTLSFLTGLIDKVTPESRPMLMKQIGDTIGIKGKHRTVWDNIMGKGRDIDTEAIQGSTQNFLGNLIGPEQGKQARAGVMIPQLIEGGQDPALRGQTLTQAAGLGNKVELEDPYQRKLQEIEARYQPQLEWAQNKFYQSEYDKGELARQAAIDKKELADHRAYIAAHSKMMEKVARMAQLNPGKSLDELTTMAAAEMDQEQGLKIGTTKDRMANIEADTKLKGGQLDALTQGGKPLEKAKFEKSIYDEVVKHHFDWNTARQQYSTSEAEVKSLEQQFQALAASKGVEFNPESSKFVTKDPKKAGLISQLNGTIPGIGQADNLKQHHAAREKQSIAAGRVTTLNQTLHNSRYKPYVETTESPGNPDWATHRLKSQDEVENSVYPGEGGQTPVAPNAPPAPKGNAPAGGPPTITVPKPSTVPKGGSAKPIAGVGSPEDGTIKAPPLNTNTYMDTKAPLFVGQRFDEDDGTAYIVVSKGGPSPVPGKNRFTVKRIK